MENTLGGLDSNLEASASFARSIQVPLKRACFFMQRFCVEGELVGDGLKVRKALEAKMMDIAVYISGL